MNIGFSVEKAVRARYSVRSYEKRPLDAGTLEKLMDYAAGLRNPLGPTARVQYIEKESSAAGEKLGTYGVIKGAGAYLAVTAPAGEYSQEALGYQFEQLVLYAAELGLGTCWLGGTFNRGAFARAIEIGEDEIFPIVSPIGWPAGKIRTAEALFRRSLGADKRLGWDKLFFEGDFGRALSETAAGDYAFPLEMLRLAPSATNRQPWRVLLRDGAFHFYELHSMAAEPGKVDMQRIDVGIAVCHFHLAALERGLSGRFERREPAGVNAPEKADYIVSWVIE